MSPFSSSTSAPFHPTRPDSLALGHEAHLVALAAALTRRVSIALLVHDRARIYAEAGLHATDADDREALRRALFWHACVASPAQLMRARWAA